LAYSTSPSVAGVFWVPFLVITDEFAIGRDFAKFSAGQSGPAIEDTRLLSVEAASASVAVAPNAGPRPFLPRDSVAGAGRAQLTTFDKSVGYVQGALAVVVLCGEPPWG
jgi:hypothetical protein